jgi:PhoPQ-activated pathogenicity-related protein
MLLMMNCLTLEVAFDIKLQIGSHALLRTIVLTADPANDGVYKKMLSWTNNTKLNPPHPVHNVTILPFETFLLKKEEVLVVSDGGK